MHPNDVPPRFALGVSPVLRWRRTMPAVAAEDGSPILLPFVRWAFSLNEGDLLAVSPDALADDSWRFVSYGERVWGAADACRQPWPYVEELLRRPMAAVGPKGVLWLPEEAQALLGWPLQFRFEIDPHTRAFVVQPYDARPHEWDGLLEAHYVLPILPGFQVMLPDDLLWVLDLFSGDPLAYEVRLNQVEYEIWESKAPPVGRSLIELGPGGLLPLPDALRAPATLKPGARVGLKMTFWDGEKSRITPDAGWTGCDVFLDEEAADSLEVVGNFERGEAIGAG